MRNARSDITRVVRLATSQGNVSSEGRFPGRLPSAKDEPWGARAPIYLMMSTGSKQLMFVSIRKLDSLVCRSAWKISI